MSEWPVVDPSKLPRPPWIRIAAAVFFLILFGFVVATFRDYGISWDEEVQNTYGNMILSFYRSGFHDRSAMHYLNLFFYGGFFDLVAAVVNLVSPLGVYVTRHLLGGIFLLVGLAGAWRLVRLLAGERAALIAIVMLALDPVLYGHSFINPKDAPLAWLILWVIYYACRAIEEGRPRVATVIGFGVMTGLAFGTRVLAGPVLVYILVALGVGALMNKWRPAYGTNPIGRTTLSLLAAAPLAYVIMGFFWPWAVIDPINNPLLAVHEFANFPWKGWLLFDGQMMPAINLPRDYLLTFLAFQLPEYALIGLIMVVISAGVVCARRGVALFADRKTLQYLILIQAAIVPVIAFVIMRPTVYNGMRHFLFVVPPLVILAAIGWDKLIAALLVRRRTVFAVCGVLGVLFLWQFLRMVDLHPYEYVAYNRLAGGIAGANGRFELDYWDTSLAEASRKLTSYLKKHPRRTLPTIFVCGNRLSATAFLPKDVKLTWKIEEADYFISIVPSACRDHVDVTKHRLIEVRRDNITLSYVIDLDAARPKAGETAPGS